MFMHMDFSWTLVLDVYFDHKFKLFLRLGSLWRWIKNEGFGLFSFDHGESIGLQSAHFFEASCLMVAGRDGFPRWAVVVGVVRHVLGDFWSLLVHVLVLSAGRIIVIWEIISFWRVGIHLNWARRSVRLRFIAQRLKRIWLFPITQQLLSKVAGLMINLGLIVEMNSWHFLFLLL